MKRQYVRLTDGVIFKSRYNQWYFIDIKKRGEERFLLEKGNDALFRFLFQGKSIQEATKKFGINYNEVLNFLVILSDNRLIEFSDCSVKSSNKCFKIEPPLDSLNILLTNACNLRCIHCCSSSGRLMKGELARKAWINILQQAKQLGVFQLNISGGEPLLHKDFFKVAEYIASVPVFSANLNTNGTVDIDGYERLLAQAFSTVQISIDDISSENHDIFRGRKGCFRKSVRTIEKLVDRGVEVNVGFTINCKNLQAIEGIVELCERIGVKSLNVGFVNPIGRAKINSSAFPITHQSLQKDGLLDQMFRVFRNLIERKTQLKILLPFRVQYDNSLLKKRYICGGDSIQFMSIMPNGIVMPCDILPMQIFACGNARTQSLIEIWHSDKMKTFKLKTLKQLPKCSDCSHLQICGGPCVARAFQVGGRLEYPDLIKCVIAEKFNTKQNNLKA